MAMSIVLTAILAMSLIVGTTYIVSEYELRYSIPFRDGYPPKIVLVYRSVRHWSGLLVLISIVVGVHVVRSSSPVRVVSYVCLMSLVALGWVLLTLLFLYFSNQSFVLT